MKVGIVIISYNNDKHIEAAIDSVRAQILDDWTCVMVDNGSTDRTFEIIQKSTAGDKRFEAYKKSNEGPGPGRNMAFSKLPENISYIHFLDGDDLLHPNFLSRMTAYLDDHPQVGLVCCKFDEIDEQGGFMGKGKRTRYAPNRLGFPHDIPENIYETPFVSFFSSTAVGPYGVYRRSVFVKTDGYTLKSQEDTDLFCQMSLLAPVHYIPEYLYLKRVTENNLARAPKYTATHKYFRKKWDLYFSDDPGVNSLIINSLKYYYRMHKPLRDFKVSMRAFRISITRLSLRALKWSMTCFVNGITDLVFHKTYRKVMRERKRVENNPTLQNQYKDSGKWDVFETSGNNQGIN